MSRVSMTGFRTATTGGSDDVVQLLERQHAAIRRGFRRALRPGPGRAERFAELRRMLATHETAEEAHVHPIARKVAPRGKALVKSRLKEERSAKRLLRQLDRMGPDADGFPAKLRELQTAVLEHARHEEREEFPVLRAAARRPRLKMLAAEAKATEAIAPTRPHPLVNSQLLNKAAAPLVGPLDRARDLAARLAGKA
jgi:hemerythrin superfamily protein